MNPSNDVSNIDGEFNKILARKSAGIKLFADQKLNEAIAEFDAVILDAKALEEKTKANVTCEGNRPKQTQIVELISNCYNNISTCNEKLVNFISLFMIKWRENSSIIIKCYEFEFIFLKIGPIYKLMAKMSILPVASIEV